MEVSKLMILSKWQQLGLKYMEGGKPEVIHAGSFGSARYAIQMKSGKTNSFRFQ